MLTRDQIFGCPDLATEEVAVPEWGGTVVVRALSAAAYDAYESSLFEIRKGNPKMAMANARARLVVRCIVGADGERIFSDADAEALGTKSSSALARVYTVAQRLCGATKADEEELAKNLESIQGAASISA